MLRAALRWTEFYQHESCGKCTPCREGSYWLVRAIQRLEDGTGNDEDLETILDVGNNIMGRAFCASGTRSRCRSARPSSTSATRSSSTASRAAAPFDPAASTAWAV